MLKNWPITFEYITAVNEIYGPEICVLKGKKLRSEKNALKNNLVKLPSKILGIRRNIILATYVMFISGITFMASLSRNIMFGSVDFL